MFNKPGYFISVAMKCQADNNRTGLRCGRSIAGLISAWFSGAVALLPKHRVSYPVASFVIPTPAGIQSLRARRSNLIIIVITTIIHPGPEGPGFGV